MALKDIIHSRLEVFFGSVLTGGGSRIDVSGDTKLSTLGYDETSMQGQNRMRLNDKGTGFGDIYKNGQLLNKSEMSNSHTFDNLNESIRKKLIITTEVSYRAYVKRRTNQTFEHFIVGCLDIAPITGDPQVRKLLAPPNTLESLRLCVREKYLKLILRPITLYGIDKTVSGAQYHTWLRMI